MAISVAELDGMQAQYKAAVEEWVGAIREEEALASTPHNEAEIDQWQGACFRQGALHKQAKDAKSAYEGALRENFFNF